MAGLIDLGVDYRTQANDLLKNVAQNETKRLNFNREMDAQRTAGEWNAAGQAVGLGAGGYMSGGLSNAAGKLGASYTLQNALKPDSQVSPTDAETADTEQLASQYEANPPAVSQTRASLNDLNAKPSTPQPQAENGTPQAPEAEDEVEEVNEPVLTEPTADAGGEVGADTGAEVGSDVGAEAGGEAAAAGGEAATAGAAGGGGAGEAMASIAAASAEDTGLVSLLACLL